MVTPLGTWERLGQRQYRLPDVSKGRRGWYNDGCLPPVIVPPSASFGHVGEVRFNGYPGTYHTKIQLSSQGPFTQLLHLLGARLVGRGE